jgi:hypothetical protein
MSDGRRIQYLARDSIVRLLSDAELAKVHAPGTTAPLSKGDEYVDLDHVAAGVRKARGATAVTGSILPRKAVKPQTWAKILLRVPMPRAPR